MSNSSKRSSTRNFSLRQIVGVLALVLCPSSAWAEDKPKEPKLPDAAALTNEQLHERIGEFLEEGRVRLSEYDACLAEVVHRGGKRHARELQRQLIALNGREIDSSPGSYLNQALLTALRRVEGKPDPLKILVEQPRVLKGNSLELPTLKVAIKNVDHARQPVGFQFGGDYRSGRQTRWRIELTGEDGQLVPAKKVQGLIMLGGLSTSGLLAYGDRWETTLDLRDYVQLPLRPGKYRLRVRYHNHQSVWNEKDISRLITSHSEEIPLVVSPTVIEQSAEAKQAVLKHWTALEGKQPVQLVAGTYGSYAHDLIDPKSPAGELYSLGLPAAPTLIEGLQQEGISPDKKAWGFAILFSLTGIHDPRNEPVLGNCEYVDAPWEIWGGIPGRGKAGGFKLTGKSTVITEVKPAAQDRLIKTWAEWLKTVEVKDAEASAPKN